MLCKARALWVLTRIVEHGCAVGTRIPEVCIGNSSGIWPGRCPGGYLKRKRQSGEAERVAPVRGWKSSAPGRPSNEPEPPDCDPDGHPGNPAARIRSRRPGYVPGPPSWKTGRSRSYPGRRERIQPFGFVPEASGSSNFASGWNQEPRARKSGIRKAKAGTGMASEVLQADQACLEHSTTLDERDRRCPTRWLSSFGGSGGGNRKGSSSVSFSRCSTFPQAGRSRQ